MLLGLLADIHERVEALEHALALLAAQEVERVIVLGDVFEAGLRAEETVELLRNAGTVGVWGNHDYGICRQQNEWMREEFSPGVLAFAASLQPRMVVEDCLFTHLEPWFDPEDPLQIWEIVERPDPAGALARSFRAAAQRVLFHGHHHRWQLSTPEGVTAWAGEDPVCLAEGRYLVNVAAVCDGRCAVYDTESGWLTPLHVATSCPGSTS